MSIIACLILGAIAGSVLWIFALAWLLARIAALRKELATAQTTLRLYRMSRSDQDLLIAELFAQNDRLAMQLVLAKAAPIALPAAPVPPARYPAGVES